MALLGYRAAGLGVGIALTWCAFALGSPASRVSVSEAEAKAVALYHLLHFAKWPPETFPAKDAPIVIGVLGADPFGKLLDDLIRGELAQGRTMRIKRFTTLSEAADCHMVFVAEPDGAERTRELKQLRLWPVLTVGDDEAFVRQGGVIALVVRDERIHILVNLENARQANIVLSAKLLKLAEVVKEHD